MPVRVQGSLLQVLGNVVVVPIAVGVVEDVLVVLDVSIARLISKRWAIGELPLMIAELFSGGACLLWRKE